MKYKEKQETLCIAKAIAYDSNRISIAFAILINKYLGGHNGLCSGFGSAARKID